jgi:20S proteasome alpha/beta subunit
VHSVYGGLYKLKIFHVASQGLGEFYSLCCVKLGKSGSEIRDMLVKVYRDNALKKTAVYKWVTCFSEGRESVAKREQDGQQ